MKKVLKIEEYADFTYLLTLPDESWFLFRDVTPKDFYTLEIEINPNNSLSEIEKIVSLYSKLILKSSVSLEELNIPEFRMIRDWVSENLLDKKLMTIESWMSLCFQLMKQRFTSDLEWYESQPMTKILAMVEVQSRYVKSMNEKNKPDV